MRLELLAAVALLAASPVSGGETHPLHNSLMEVSHDASRKSLDVSLRVFADDFTMAADAYVKVQPAGAREKEATLARYARASITIADPSGKPVDMGFCGSKLVGEMIWICFRATDTTGGSGIRIGSRVLFDHFSDQINLVRVSYSGKTALLMFTPGDGDRIVR